MERVLFEFIAKQFYVCKMALAGPQLLYFSMVNLAIR